MSKKFLSAILFILIFCGVSSAAETVTEYNPYNLNYLYLDSGDEAAVYDLYGNSDYNFFYQLRDITGSTRNEKVAGPQWFATVYENYYYHFLRYYLDEDDDDYVDIYRRTMGGETPEVTLSVVGDVIDGFNFVFAEEPQPYENYWRRFSNLGVYDVYPDPLESLCLVITNGQGEFNIDFGNPYARHFPFWWGWSTEYNSSIEKWWQRHLNWRDVTYPTAEPIKYIFSSPDVYAHTKNLTEYEKIYTLGVSTNSSGDVTGRVIFDTSGETAYTISGDMSSGKFYLYSSGDLNFTISDDKIYNASNTLLYTIEDSRFDDSDGDLYICEVRTVNQTVSLTNLEDIYSVTIQPSTEKAINSGESLSSIIRLRGNAENYGSTLGYLTLKQRASFATGYSNYRQSTTIPVVVANVANGGAEVEPLIFDIIIYDNENNVVSRKKFTWDVREDLQQDLGTFMVIDSYSEEEENNEEEETSETTTYYLETRITNRTGTRYELFRYDGISSRNNDVEYRDKYRNIMPDYWKYDLTRDTYGTLPDRFLLDAHSQIAPGLITVYGENIGEGYSSMIVGNVITDSFRLYEYSNPTPKNLSFTYRRINGNVKATDDAGAGQTIVGSSGESSSVLAFTKYFADDTISKATLSDLFTLMEKIPVVIPIEILNEDDPVIPQKINNAGADTTNAFWIDHEVPDGFVPYVEVVEEEEESADQEPATEENNEQGTEENNDEGETAAFYFAASGDIVYSTDNKVAILPLKIRMTLPRNNSFIRNSWEELDAAENSEALFDKFSQLASVWVKVPSTVAYDGEVDLFRAVNTAENRGGVEGVTARDCIDVSINNDDDELYIDFTVFVADAGAPLSRQNVNPERPEVSAFIYTFEDDKVPYILIGDGKVDKYWNVGFFVAAPDTSTSSTTESESEEESKNVWGHSSSSSCNFGFSFLAGIILLMIPLRKSF